MRKYIVAFAISLLSACSSGGNKALIKFVNKSIPAEHANIIFTKDSNDCVHESTSNRPVIYKDCRVYGFNPSMQKECSRENDDVPVSYKRITKKLYKKCLLNKGWEEEIYKEEIAAPVNINKVVPIYPNEAASLCIKGEVTLAFSIKNDGSVKDIMILKAKPKGVFDTAAINAISEWRFKIQPTGTEKKELRAKQTLYFKLNKPCCNNTEIIDDECKVTK